MEEVVRGGMLELDGALDGHGKRAKRLAKESEFHGSVRSMEDEARRMLQSSMGC